MQEPYHDRYESVFVKFNIEEVYFFCDGCFFALCYALRPKFFG